MEEASSVVPASPSDEHMRLPSELISDSLQYLLDEKDTLLSCRLVSHIFAEISLPVLFQQVKLQLDCPKQRIRGKTLKTFETFLKSHPKRPNAP